jgi:hypothetical protein
VFQTLSFSAVRTFSIHTPAGAGHFRISPVSGGHALELRFQAARGHLNLSTQQAARSLRFDIRGEDGHALGYRAHSDRSPAALAAGVPPVQFTVHDLQDPVRATQVANELARALKPAAPHLNTRVSIDRSHWTLPGETYLNYAAAAARPEIDAALRRLEGTAFSDVLSDLHAFSTRPEVRRALEAHLSQDRHAGGLVAFARPADECEPYGCDGDSGGTNGSNNVSTTASCAIGIGSLLLIPVHLALLTSGVGTAVWLAGSVLQLVGVSLGCAGY